MARQAYLAFDLGAESGRAMLGLLDGDVLSLEEMHRFPTAHSRLPDGMHWDLLGLWNHLVEGLGKAGAYCREQKIDLVSLGVDTWGVDIALQGESGAVLGLPFCYRDPRHVTAAEQTLEKHSHAKIYEATGMQHLPFNTIFQLVAYRNSEPKLLAAARQMLFMPDLLHFFFTGRAVNEATIASTSSMIDPHTRQWALPLLGELDLPTHMLGHVINAGELVGQLRPELAEAADVRADLRVIAPASHDTASAIAAVPADPDRPWAYLSSGTWSLLGVELAQPLVNDAAREANFTNEGGVDGTIRFLKNIGGLWLVQESRRYYEAQGRSYDYETLTRQAAEAEPFRTIVDTWHPPFLQPGKMPEKIAAFAEKTGQPKPETVGQTIRCCLESLALTYRKTLADAERLTDRAVEVLHIVGGGGKNELLNQMTANAIGKPVVVGPYEATAAGNALVQAMGAGNVEDLAHIRRIVRNSFAPKTFEPTDTGQWDAAYERFETVLGQ